MKTRWQDQSEDSWRHIDLIVLWVKALRTDYRHCGDSSCDAVHLYRTQSLCLAHCPSLVWPQQLPAGGEGGLLLAVKHALKAAGRGLAVRGGGDMGRDYRGPTNPPCNSSLIRSQYCFIIKMANHLASLSPCCTCVCWPRSTYWSTSWSTQWASCRSFCYSFVLVHLVGLPVVPSEVHLVVFLVVH